MVIRKEKTTEVKEEYTSEFGIVLLFIAISNIAFFSLLLIVMYSGIYGLFGENWLFYLLPVHILFFFTAYIFHVKQHKDDDLSFFKYVFTMFVVSIVTTILVFVILRTLRVLP